MCRRRQLRQGMDDNCTHSDGTLERNLCHVSKKLTLSASICVYASGSLSLATAGVCNGEGMIFVNQFATWMSPYVSTVAPRGTPVVFSSRRSHLYSFYVMQ